MILWKQVSLLEGRVRRYKKELDNLREDKDVLKSQALAYQCKKQKETIFKLKAKIKELRMQIGGEYGNKEKSQFLNAGDRITVEGMNLEGKVGIND